MSWLAWVFEWISKIAQIIANLDYLYIEWLIGLIYPFLLFLLSLFVLPLAMALISFVFSFYIFINKHKQKLLVSAIVTVITNINYSLGVHSHLDVYTYLL
jgi:hypothetical protein